MWIYELRHWSIRREIVKNKSLSCGAHTAKVIVRDATWSVSLPSANQLYSPE